MARTGHVLVRAATAVSGLCCATLMTVWAASYFASLYAWRAPHAGHWRVGVSVTAGCLQVDWGQFWNYSAPSFATNENPPWDRSGFRWGAAARSDQSPGWWGATMSRERQPVSLTKAEGQRRFKVIGWFPTTTVSVAFWPLVLLTGGLPAVRLARRHRSARPGHCTVCGYDLRATPEHCPECGTAGGPSSSC